MENNIKIECLNGITNTVKVTQNGIDLQNITKIEIYPMLPNEAVKAKLTFEFVEIDMMAKQVLDDK